jgi:hypothetical protein
MVRIKTRQFRERQTVAAVSAAALLLAVAAAGISAGAQQPPDSPPVVHLPGSQPPSSVAADGSAVYVSGSSGEPSPDPAARKDAAKLAELTGLRQKISQNFAASMQNGLDEMRRRYPNLDSRFVAEWEKRMRAQFKADEYVAVFTRVYAQHFTAGELEEMIDALRARQNSQPVTFSPQLAEKIRGNAVQIQSELIGGFTEVGARQGGEIGKQIGKEHPDWVRNMESTAPETTK